MIGNPTKMLRPIYSQIIVVSPVWSSDVTSVPSMEYGHRRGQVGVVGFGVAVGSGVGFGVGS